MAYARPGNSSIILGVLIKLWTVKRVRSKAASLYIKKSCLSVCVKVYIHGHPISAVLRLISGKFGPRTPKLRRSKLKLS